MRATDAGLLLFCSFGTDSSENNKGPVSAGPLFRKVGENRYGLFVGLGNPPGLVVVAGVLVPEG
jgi:hypothetical protein